MNDDVRRRLEKAGRRPVVPPDPAFADALEARLRAVAASLPPAPAPPPATSLPPVEPPRPRRRRPLVGWWAAAAGLAAVVVVAGIGLGLLRPDRAPGPGTALEEPVNVEVVLVNGTVLEDPDGLLLPEGAIVRVGEEGSARIGDTVLGPGDVATVRADRVEVQRPMPVSVVPGGTPAGSPAPVGSPGAPAGTPSVSPPPATPTPQRSGSPAPTRSPAPPADTEPPATAALTPTPTPAILRPRLRAVLIDGPRIAVRWTATWSAARYVLVATASRSGPAADPVYPGSRVIGEFAAPPERAFRVRVPEGVVEIRLMVVALREDGRVLRRSRIVTVVVPAVESIGSGTGPSLTPAPSPTPAP